MSKKVIVLGGLALLALVVLISSFGGADTANNDAVTVTAKQGEHPNAKDFANAFIGELKQVAADKSINFKIEKNSRDAVVYTNMAYVIPAKTKDNEATDVAIKRAQFNDNGTAIIEGFSLGSTSKNDEKVAFGLKRIEISNYKVENDLVISYDQRFTGGIAMGSGLKELQTQYDQIIDALKDQPKSLQDMPEELLQSLKNLDGLLTYRYNPKTNALGTGLTLDLPNLTALNFALNMKEVDDKSARLVQQSTLFGHGSQNLPRELKNYDFKGVLNTATISLANNGLVDKAITLVAGLQRSNPLSTMDSLKEKTRTTAVQFINGFPAPAQLPENNRRVLDELKAALTQILEDKADKLTITINQKADGLSQTLPQAVQSGFDQYNITITGE